MHTDTPTGRLILLLSTPNRALRAARRTAETILPCASDTNSAPQEPLRSLFAKADASAAVADSMPRTQRPRRPFRLRRKTAVRRGKRSNEAKRFAEAKPDGCLSQHRKNRGFPHVWMKQVHTCGKLHRTVHKLWKRLPRLPDGHLLPDRRVWLWRVAFRARSPAASRRRQPRLVAWPLPPSAVSPFVRRLPSSAASPLSSASRHRLPPLCLPPPVTSGLPACSCGFRRSLRPSRSRLARRRP